METSEISANVNNITLTAAAAADHNKLCNLWPTVKEGLQLLATFISNPVVKVIISTVISAGDAIIGKICN
ncbi:hypothetical protein [Mucilaginibacter xinganensis]|uniref:Uncharacterized protein n=1 Tax=Mucilaginibacter xinganensis TaxID=1234841 RepID=A0A223P1K7_9SPHI|nr:hypothetical protein [Mucilaginibacter xinganensis]ASU35966.1 hypothetical protein MuYL_4081 [Mucilaginibacter xinganensis]